MNQLLRDKKAIIVFILPTLLVYIVFTFYPICQSLYFSFFDGVPGLDFKFTGFSNFSKLFADKVFIGSLTTTIKYVLITATGQLVLGLLTALFLKYGMKRFVNLSRTMIYMPVVIPAVGVAALFSKIYEIQPNYGLLNGLLAAVGLESMVKSWIGSSATALGALCIADIWRSIGYYTVIFYAGIVAFPKELEEAARIDGASTLQTIKRILMPILRPVTIMSVILCLNNTFKVYDMPTVLTMGGPGRATYVLSLYTYQTAFYDWRYGYASLLAVMMMFFILLVTQGVNYLNRKNNEEV